MEIKKLNHYIKNNHILKNIDITLSNEKVNVLIGRNGVGKSTLLDIMARLHAEYENNLINFPDENEVAYQLQGVPFLTTLSGKQISNFFLNADYKKNKIELDNEEKLMLKKLENKKLGEMSGGERRWLITVCICTLDRKLYLFDEPLSGIDPIFSEKILDKLNTLAEKGKTVVMTTHQFNYLEHIKPNIIYLKEGKVIFNDTYDVYIDLTVDNSIISSYKFLNGDHFENY